MPLSVREAQNEACSFWLPLQAARYLKRSRRTATENRLDLVGPLAAVGAQPGGQDINRSERATVTGEHHFRVKRNEPRQARQVLDQAAATAETVAIFEAGYRDDSRQQMVSAEKDARGGVPQ